MRRRWGTEWPEGKAGNCGMAAGGSLVFEAKLQKGASWEASGGVLNPSNISRVRMDCRLGAELRG